MADPSQVSAVIVTRGNVDLTPVLDSLIFDDVVIWDNSVEDDEMTYGRVRALERCRHAVVYSQDDDIVHTADNQRAICSAYEPGVMTGCMWPEWSAGAKQQGIDGGYDDLVFPGSGSVTGRIVPALAVARYLEFFPADDFFRLWCDTIVGVLAETRPLNIRFEALPWAEDGNRMCDLPDAVALKTEAISRARYVRDMTRPGAALSELLFEWKEAREVGWSRALSAAEARVVLAALDRLRCDQQSPDGIYQCDKEPQHAGAHKSCHGVEWGGPPRSMYLRYTDA